MLDIAVHGSIMTLYDSGWDWALCKKDLCLCRNLHVRVSKLNLLLWRALSIREQWGDQYHQLMRLTRRHFYFLSSSIPSSLHPSFTLPPSLNHSPSLHPSYPILQSITLHPLPPPPPPGLEYVLLQHDVGPSTIKEEHQDEGGREPEYSSVAHPLGLVSSVNTIQSVLCFKVYTHTHTPL